VQAGSQGTLKVDGGTLTVEGELEVGDGGSGSLTISDGGMVSAQTVQIGTAGASMDTVTLDVDGTLTAGSVEVGADGHIAMAGGMLDPPDAVTIDPSGSVGGYGSIVGDLTNDGRLEAAGGTLAISGAVTGTGQIIVDANANLNLEGSVASGQIVSLDGTTNSTILTLGDPSDFAATINGFAAGPVIDLAKVGFDPDGQATLEAGNVLQITENGNTYNLHLDPTQNLAGESFQLAADSAGTGTAITATGPAAAPPPLLVVLGPTTATVIQGHATAIAGVSLSEPDSVLNEMFSVTVSDTNGQLSATGPGVTGLNTNNLSIAGTLVQVNADLSTLSDTDPSAVGDAITVTAQDGFGSIASQSFPVTVTPPPTLAVLGPATATLIESIATPISGISLSEPDSVANEMFSVSVSDTHGLLSATGAGVIGSNVDQLSIAGTLVQVNADLATLSDTDPISASDEITVTAQDGFGSVASDSIPVTVTPPLPLTVAGPATVTVMQDKTTAINGVNVSEPGSVASEMFSVTVSDTDGLLSATGTGVSNSGTDNLIISGSLPQVNADLATLSDTDSTTAGDQIIVSAEDGFGSIATQSVGVTVTPPPAPTVVAPATVALTQGNATAITGVSVSESASAANAMFSVAVSDTNGLLSATGSGVTGSGTANLAIAGTLAQINADLATLSDTDPTTAGDQIIVSAQDGFGNIATESIGVTVTPPPPPELFKPPAVSVIFAHATAINGLQVVEPGGGNANTTYTATISWGDGQVTATGPGVMGSGTGTVTITGSLIQANADLATVTFTTTTIASNANTTNGGTVTFTVTESGIAGNSTSSSASFQVTVTPPQITGFLGGTTGIAGGAPAYLWSNAANWTTGVPINDAAVNINNAATGGSGGYDDIPTLNLSTLTLTQGQLAVGGSLSVIGDALVGNGGTGGLEVVAGGELSAQSVQIGTGAGGSGTVTLDAGGTLTAGSVEIGPDGVIAVAGGVLDPPDGVTVDGELSGNGTVDGVVTIDSTGLVSVDSGTLDFVSGSVVNNNQILVKGATLDIGGDLSGNGVVSVADGSVELDSSVSSGQLFIIDPSTIDITDPGSFSGTLDLSSGDELIVTGATGGSYANGVFTLTDNNGNDIIGTIAAPGYVSGDFSFTAGAGDTLDITDTQAPCYCRGTLILTDRGERPVEELAIGDRVITVAGELKPIKWIGRRGYNGRFIRGQRSVLPIVVSAGALAPGVPTRDLWVSPEHALYIDRVLVPAKLLVNGMTIAQVEAVERLEYFHIELDSHDVILAEGAPAESYVECDNRLMFHNAAEFTALYPAALPDTGRFYALRIGEGMAAETIRERLLGRAAALGHRVTDDPGLYLIADGVAVEPLAVEDGVYRFTLQHPASAVYLASRSAVPAETDAASRDRRRLGVCLRRITLRDADLTLDLVPEHHLLREGFHEAEGEHRWTAGMARLPASVLGLFAGPIDIEIALHPTDLRYPLRSLARRHWSDANAFQLEAAG